ncbi:hypothetical protein C5167_026518 [Papaver somniferum]|uniref:WAP four-disulfide core domain protein 8-like n=1 Tax=Papaver somniferum TaxID=3469 RepID=UPI000E6FD45C|nr:WAP four-disulfide core domain protein 8-like [Papaver somniferum]RZC85862.1 hypothetical protein C5167_026518 [Papaver somniferum]
MAATKSFSGALLLLVLFIFVIVGMLEMPSAAAISCGPGETSTESRSVSHPMIYCYGCQDQCITQCKSQGREVSQLECNFWGSEQAVCKCCCGLPSSTPPSKPIIWNQCPPEETNKYFDLQKSVIDCSLCVNGCKTKCEAIGATATREVCFQNFQVGTTTLIDQHLVCPCCCKPNPPPSPSPPPCPCSGSCGVNIDIQISSAPGQSPCKYELPQLSSSTAEL